MSMSTSEGICANCGKGEEAGSSLKACTACKLVKYCSRDCQIAHRPQHKKACKKRAKELHDEKLFKQPPPLEDCPICMIRLPTLATGKTYMACCGKVICSGCIHAVQIRALLAGRSKEDDVCPFCRTPPLKSDAETIERTAKRVELNDPLGISDQLERASELHDEKLFKLPPPKEDCPICMIRLPYLSTGQTYMVCCGKIICSGCVYAFQSRATKQEHNICPFCRTPPPPTDVEMVKRYKKRIKMDDSEAILNLGCFYRIGKYGCPQNVTKALELWHRAGELGCAEAYCNIGACYDIGRGVDVDKKKAIHYWELAAMGGDTDARHNLGVREGLACNMGRSPMEIRRALDRAFKHFMIAVKDGYAKSLQNIEYFYKNGYATKDDYTEALRSYQAYLDEIKSDQRDKAMKFSGSSYYER